MVVNTGEIIVLAIESYVAYWLWIHGHKIWGFIFLILAVGSVGVVLYGLERK